MLCSRHFARRVQLSRLKSPDFRKTNSIYHFQCKRSISVPPSFRKNANGDDIFDEVPKYTPDSNYTLHGSALMALLAMAVADSVEKEEKDPPAPEKKKKRIGFRDRKIIEYENRIRMYSTPDKTFRYFATLKVHNKNTDEWEIMMSPDDFLRSITPNVKQPDGLGLDQYKKFDPSSNKHDLLIKDMGLVKKDSVFFQLSEEGLISFSDYLFLLTLLSTPWRYFEMSFKMFDINGDGDVDFSEYEKLLLMLQRQTAVGSRHRDHKNTGNVSKPFSQSALSTYFFGRDLSGKLTLSKFEDFHNRYTTEVLLMGFDAKIDRDDPVQDDTISESDFGAMLLNYAHIPKHNRVEMLRRVKKRFCKPPKVDGDSIEASEEWRRKGITRSEYLAFMRFVHSIDDIDTALSFYHISCVSITKETIKRVTTVTNNEPLSDHVIDVVFELFDQDRDGGLSYQEFVSIMKKCLNRGLEKPKELGLFSLLSAALACLPEAIWNSLTINTKKD